jgi:nucleotide-binding universal stress UspA family protein
MPQSKFVTFLLAIDGSIHANRAAEYVARRASRLEACQVQLVNVHTGVVAGGSGQQDLMLQAGTETAIARGLLDAAGIVYKLHSELGDPASRILDLVRSEGCDEVVVGSRGLSALGNIALGSVAYKTLHLSPVPVTVVPNPFGASGLDLEDGEDVHRILLPVDGSQSAAHAVDYVCSLQKSRIPVEVRLLNAQVLVASGNVRRFVSAETINAYCQAEGEEALAPARKALQAAGLSCEESIVTGQAAQSIVKAGSQSGCTRIVMGTRGLGALGNVVMGSTALQVMHLSEIPVTLVK